MFENFQHFPLGSFSVHKSKQQNLITSVSKCVQGLILPLAMLRPPKNVIMFPNCKIVYRMSCCFFLFYTFNLISVTGREFVCKDLPHTLHVAQPFLFLKAIEMIFHDSLCLFYSSQNRCFPLRFMQTYNSVRFFIWPM